MRSKTIFTTSEIALIEKLIEEKLKADSEKQKNIRSKIRKLGFYWVDFHEKGKVKYNIENFRNLILNKTIKVIPTYDYDNVINNAKLDADNKHQVKSEYFKEGLEPWVGVRPKVLILGTMPGDISIKEQLYYANIQYNSFWKIMYCLFIKQQGQNNKDFITSQGIALWDCFKEGIRKGSTDKGFDNKRKIPNDLILFLKKYSTIKTIILNGKTTQKEFYKFFPNIRSYEFKCLCSTSNSCTLSLEQKINEWSIIKDILKRKE